MSVLWFIKNLWAVRCWIITIIAFVVPWYLLVCNTAESKCLYAIIVMAIIWLTEALPISVTALFPIFLFPMLGIVPGKDVCSKYVNDTSMLFLGGLIVAVAIEESGLHKRMALGIMKIVGATPNLLLLGLMIPTWFLSMWISNTATTSMMLPIITAVVDQMKASELGEDGTQGADNQAFDDSKETEQNDKKSVPDNDAADERDVKISCETRDSKDIKRRSNEITRLSKVFALGVAYASNSGGIATLVGTPPNLILQGVINEKYDDYSKGADSGVSFANWMGFALPLSIIILVLAWVWLQLLFIRCGCFKAESRERARQAKTVIDREFRKLGQISFAEIMVLILFVCLALLWIFRDLPDISGWSLLFKESYVRDSTASIFIACLFFVMPAEMPKIFCFSRSSETPKFRPILEWHTTVQRIPWGVIILLGGGFALADASKVSGLSKWLSCELQSINEYEPWIINLIIASIVAASTEVTSNTATATLLLPIMFDLIEIEEEWIPEHIYCPFGCDCWKTCTRDFTNMLPIKKISCFKCHFRIFLKGIKEINELKKAIGLNLHPLYMMISVCIACSFAFMLPVATPPNAIVFSTGYLKIYDMALAGIMMNVIGIAGLTLAVNTWAKPIFGLDTIPDIFQGTNSTSETCSDLCPV